jgi:hypothetical protein
MGHAGARLGHQLDFILIKTDAVDPPDIGSHPLELAHQLCRPHAELAQAEFVPVQRLSNMGMEGQVPLAGKGGRRAHEIGHHGKGRAGCDDDTAHGIGIGVVILREHPLKIGQDGVFVLHHRVGREAAFRSAQRHAAPAGMRAHLHVHPPGCNAAAGIVHGNQHRRVCNQ